MTKVYLKTYGCAHNQSDSEYMAGVLKQNDFELVQSKKSADIVVFNTCTVKDPSEKKIYSELDRLDKPVVVAGCVPQADKKNSELKKYSLLGVNQLSQIAEVVEQTLAGNTVHLLKRSRAQDMALPKVRRNNLIEIIPISSGCMGYCTFCKTKQARGGLSSHKPKEIIKRFRQALNEGVKEVWLTSEDTGPYGLEIKTTLPELLRELLKIKKDFRIRLGMINPEYVSKYFDELVDIYQDDRMFKFLHIPVQSGDNQVLKDMNREYAVEEFKEVVDKIRQKVPNITIATDIICGFPTESEEAFGRTLDLVRELQFPIINFSKFYPRPGTKAAKMDLLPTRIVKSRSKKLTELNNSLDVNEDWIGWKGEVLVDEKGKKGTFLARNDYYKQVVLEGDFSLGDRIFVKVTDGTRDYLVAVPER